MARFTRCDRCKKETLTATADMEFTKVKITEPPKTTVYYESDKELCL